MRKSERVREEVKTMNEMRKEFERSKLLKLQVFKDAKSEEDEE